VNAFYYKAFVYSLIRASGWLFVIDRFNYVLASLSQAISSRFRRSHTGVLSYNMAGVLIGLMLFALLMLWVFG